MAEAIKILKDGKISVSLKNKKVRLLITESVLCRMINEDNEIIATLLSEIKEKIEKADGTRMKLTRSQFTAIIDRQTINYLEPGEQIFLAASLNPEFKTIKRL